MEARVRERTWRRTRVLAASMATPEIAMDAMPIASAQKYAELSDPVQSFNRYKSERRDYGRRNASESRFDRKC